MFDLKSRDGVARLEAEDLGVEGQLRLERRHDRLRLAEPVALALEEQIGVRDPRSRSAPTISSAWEGGTTMSSAPWRTSIGVRIWSTKWIALRAR